MASGSTGGGVSPFKTILQIGLVVATFALWETPFLQPIKLMVVMLHEMSHGLMALATGGTVNDIVITPNEGGACHTSGGNAMLIISAGYLGSMLFGGMILTASRSRTSSAAVFSLLAFLLFGAAFTVMQDGYSRKFALGVAAAAIVVGGFSPRFLSSLILRAVGTVSSLYAIVDIYSDVLSADARQSAAASDAAAFAELTGIDATTIGMGWLIVSVIFFAVMLKRSVAETEDEPAGSPAPATA